MENKTSSPTEERILILAPTGRDAEMAAGVFAREGWAAQICRTLAELLALLPHSTGPVLLAAEALRGEGMTQLTGELSRQPEWSDLPILLLTGATSAPGAGERLERFGGHGNVTQLERPLRLATLVTATRAALRARRRQFQVRELLAQREQARQEALEANRTKDHFLAALSHELRTPLTPVLLTIAALRRDGGITGSVRADLDLIQRNVELEAKLIDDLLDLTRITRGKLLLNRTVVDLHELLGQTIEMCCDPERLAAGLSINVRMTGPERHVFADSPRLQQVLWNLLNNAIKFTPATGSITIAAANPAPGWLQITVRDTGIGIEPHAMPHVFEAFAQGDASITRHFGGLGLGLAISKTLVELHEGTLEVTSPGTGQGATFTLHLRTVPAPAAGSLPDQPAEADPIPPLRILLVEDNEPTRQILARLLRRNGHEVHPAGTVAAALQLARERRFDLLVTDLGLPDGTGLELMRAVREIRPLPGIALSGYGMEEDLNSTAAAGFETHLIKPIEWTSLEGALRKVATRRRV